jgi:hypothetical protein
VSAHWKRPATLKPVLPGRIKPLLPEAIWTDFEQITDDQVHLLVSTNQRKQPEDCWNALIGLTDPYHKAMLFADKETPSLSSGPSYFDHAGYFSTTMSEISADLIHWKVSTPEVEEWCPTIIVQESSISTAAPTLLDSSAQHPAYSVVMKTIQGRFEEGKMFAPWSFLLVHLFYHTTILFKNRPLLRYAEKLDEAVLKFSLSSDPSESISSQSLDYTIESISGLNPLEFQSIKARVNRAVQESSTSSTAILSMNALLVKGNQNLAHVFAGICLPVFEACLTASLLSHNWSFESYQTLMKPDVEGYLLIPRTGTTQLPLMKEWLNAAVVTQQNLMKTLNASDYLLSSTKNMVVKLADLIQFISDECFLKSILNMNTLEKQTAIEKIQETSEIQHKDLHIIEDGIKEWLEREGHLDDYAKPDC